MLQRMLTVTFSLLTLATTGLAQVSGSQSIVGCFTRQLNETTTAQVDIQAIPGTVPTAYIGTVSIVDQGPIAQETLLIATAGPSTYLAINARGNSVTLTSNGNDTITTEVTRSLGHGRSATPSTRLSPRNTTQKPRRIYGFTCVSGRHCRTKITHSAFAPPVAQTPSGPHTGTTNEWTRK